MARIGTVVGLPPWQDRDVALDERPAIRAGWSARVLRAVGRLDAGPRDAIVSRTGAKVVEAIRGQSAMSWLPMSDHVRLIDALVSTLGADEARALLRDTSLRNMRSSLLAASVSATLRVFGVGPLALVRMFPRGFRLITRGCGVVTVATFRDARGTEISFTQLPEPLRVAAWAISMSAVFDAAMEIGKVSGTVEADTQELDRGILRIHMLADNRDSLVHDVGDR